MMKKNNINNKIKKIIQKMVFSNLIKNKSISLKFQKNQNNLMDRVCRSQKVFIFKVNILLINKNK